MSELTTAELRVTSPGELVELVPYLLGFRPEDSLVLVWLRHGSIAVTARLDLTDCTSAEILATTLSQIQQQSCSDQVVAVAFCADADFATEILQVLSHVLPDSVMVMDLLRVDKNRWWSLHCTDAECCPIEGTEFDNEISPVAAHAVYLGLSVFPDRQAVFNQLHPYQCDATLEQLLTAELAEHATRQSSHVQQLMADFISRTDPGLVLSAQECIRLSVLCTEASARDLAWSAIATKNAHNHVLLWSQVIRYCWDRYALAPLCLLGMAAWLGGNGVLLRGCIERAEEHDYSHPMLAFLRDVATQCLPPTSWDIADAGLSCKQLY